MIKSKKEMTAGEWYSIQRAGYSAAAAGISQNPEFTTGTEKEKKYLRNILDIISKRVKYLEIAYQLFDKGRLLDAEEADYFVKNRADGQTTKAVWREIARRRKVRKTVEEFEEREGKWSGTRVIPKDKRFFRGQLEKPAHTRTRTSGMGSAIELI